MDDPAIEAVGLRRVFRPKTGWFRPQRREICAVDGIDLAIGRGELFGLLGPNGAGKTTAIKMLCTLLLPTEGQARVLGRDVATETRAVRRSIGYVFGGDKGLYDRLSGLDNLRYFAELYGVPAREQRRRIGELLELVGLTGREGQRVEGYSRGMRQRLHIARGLLHKPEVLFLDEPSIGVDPVAARELRTTVAQLAESGTTVLLTTHYMAEAEELCDRIAIIAAGRIQALGTADELKRMADGRRILEVMTYGANQDMIAGIRAMPQVQSLTTEPKGQHLRLDIQSDASVDIQAEVLAALAGAQVSRVESRASSLEDAYVALVATAKVEAQAER